MHADGTGMKAKPHKYGSEVSDGSVDAWISLLRMYLEDCKGPERTRVLTLITFLHKHAQAWIMQKPQNERDSCQKIFNLLSKRFGIGNSSKDARLQFDVRKQEPNENLFSHQSVPRRTYQNPPFRDYEEICDWLVG